LKYRYRPLSRVSGTNDIPTPFVPTYTNERKVGIYCETCVRHIKMHGLGVQGYAKNAAENRKSRRKHGGMAAGDADSGDEYGEMAPAPVEERIYEEGDEQPYSSRPAYDNADEFERKDTAAGEYGEITVL
jgi:hypothetical protein